MNKKKIGIITFHRADNYGAVLQNLALLRFIEKFENVDVDTIDYRCEYLEKPYRHKPFELKSSNTIKNIFFFIRKKIYEKRYLILRKKFDSFRKTYLNMTKSYDACNLKDVLNKYDVFVTGSDQVWNDSITGSDIVYSLGFVQNKKTISYAASAGRLSGICGTTKENIKRLDVISVREDDLKEYIEQDLNREAELVCDPVFLLSHSEWNQFLPKERILQEKYVFTYSVSEKTNDVIKIAKRIAKNNRCKIAHLDFSYRYATRGIQMYGIAPLDFLRLIRDAEVVIASSFHAVAFSIIFRKKFIVVPTEGTGGRIQNLLNLAMLHNRSVNSYSDYQGLDTEISCEYSEGLQELIENSKKFIESYIVK